MADDRRYQVLRTIQYLIAALWVGSLWTVGYLVAPVLFATLADRALAGKIAGSLFNVEAWWSVGAALFLVLSSWAVKSSAENRTQSVYQMTVIAMLVCTIVGYFGLQPFMAAIRQAAAMVGGVMTPEQHSRFAWLHGASGAFFMVQSLVGIWLLLQIRRASRS